MQRLSDKGYWDSMYAKINDEKKSSGRFRKFIKYVTRDFSNYVFSEVLLPRYLPVDSDLKMIEIGCAPGKYLLGFNARFGYSVYGVEYSENGTEKTRANFQNAGLDPAHVLQADFFDPSFQKSNREAYDVVFSRGFIEHFDDVGKVIDAHLQLLRRKGYLVVSIPNVCGLNSFILKHANRDSWKTHNFDIMEYSHFRNLFERKGLDILYCDYVGTFSFGLFNTNSRWKHYFHRLLLLLQRPFDFLWRAVLGPRHLRYRYTSPYLLFIGRKQ